MARFTDRQIEDAKRVDLADYLRRNGETLKPSGAEYRWVYRDGSGEHDSVTVRGCEWFDHKRQVGGDAIGFLQEYMGMDFREAVAVLIHQKPAELDRSSSLPPEPKSKSFELPERAQNMHRLYAYLCKSRSIDHEVVTHFVRAGLLYEDAKYHNAVFIATDEQNKLVGGMKKSTLSGSSFRQTIAGSDTRYAFRHNGTSNKVYVFEAAVDMLSYVTLHSENWRAHSYLALDGVSSKPLLHFLGTYPEVREVCLCLDNDAAGIEASRRIAAQLQERGYDEVSVLSPEQKDWNEDLQSGMQQAPEYPALEMECDLL